MAVKAGIFTFLKLVVGIGTAVGTGTKIAVGVTRILAVALLTKALTPRPPLPEFAAQKIVSVRSTLQPRRVIYGTDRVGGLVAFSNLSGTANANLHSMLALAGFEVDDVTDVIFDDDTIADSDIDGAGTVISGPFAQSTTTLVRQNGFSKVAHNVMGPAFTDWTSNHRGYGIPDIDARLSVVAGAEDVYERGAPQNIGAIVKGRRVYDPRLDTTNTDAGGSGSHRFDTPSTWAWSDNPALVAADYLANTTYGMAATFARINWAVVAASADRCEETVTVPDGVGGSTTQARHRCNVTLECTTQHGQNLDILASAMVGRIERSQGVWQVVAGDAATATVTITDDWVVGRISSQLQTPARERYNRVRGNYIDPARGYQAVPYTEISNSVYETDDGGERYTSKDWPACQNEYEAQRNAILWSRMSRLQEFIEVKLDLRGWALMVGAVVNVTLSELSLTAQPFLIVEREFNGFNEVTLKLKEWDSTVFNDPVLGDYSEKDAQGAITFANQGVPVITNLVGLGTGVGHDLSWSLPAYGTYTSIQVWAATTDDRTTATLVADINANRVSIPHSSLTTTYYWVRAARAGKFSEWEPVATPGGLQVTGGGGAAALLADPNFSLALGVAWQDVSPTGSVSITAGGGENGANSLELDCGIGETATARVVSGFEVAADELLTIIVRWSRPNPGIDTLRAGVRLTASVSGQTATMVSTFGPNLLETAFNTWFTSQITFDLSNSGLASLSANDRIDAKVELTGISSLAGKADIANVQVFRGPGQHVFFDTTDKEKTAGVTPSNKVYASGEQLNTTLRYGDLTGTDDTTLLDTALSIDDMIQLPPDATIYLDELSVAAAGKTIRGAGRFSTIIRPVSGITAGNALIHNANRASGTSYGITIEDLWFQLHDASANVDCIGIDLGSIGSASLNRLRIEGFSKTGANATGVLFAAPISSQSYFNRIADCDFNKLEVGCEWLAGANGQRLSNVQFNSCLTGCDVSVASGTPPDAVGIEWCRYEACTLGIKEGSKQAFYLGNRFEANVDDMEFTTDSVDCHIFGGSTASASGTVLKNKSNATGLVIFAPDLGTGEYRSDSASRAFFWRGPLIISPYDHSETDTTPGGQSAASLALYLAGGRLTLDNNQWISWVDNAGSGAVLGWALNASDEMQTDTVVKFKSYTVATLPAAAGNARMIYVSDETGGGVMAWSDGTNWRRVSDGAVVS